MKANFSPTNRLGLAAVFAAAWGALVVQGVAAPVPQPIFEPDGGTWPAPLKVEVRSAARGASVNITLDGREPTPRDTEIESGAEVVVDEPLTLKAKAWLADGSASATKTATYVLRPVAGNGASFVDQSVPVLMAAGQTQQIGVILRNIGTLPWTRGAHTLAAARAKDAQLWSIAPVAPAEPVATWAAATFRVKITAPTAPGTYNLHFQMQTQGQGFGEATPVVRVAVVSVETYEGETKVLAERNSAPAGKAAAVTTKRTDPLPKEVAAALAAAKARSEPATASELDRLVRELHYSTRSFRYLRTIGFAHSDEEFAQLVAAHPKLFRTLRIIRRDEHGQRVIPGWPGVGLVGGR